MPIEPVSSRLAGAFRASAEHLERLGGEHSLSAARLRRELEIVFALRLAERDNAIVALRAKKYAAVSDNAAAGAIAAEIKSYASTVWKRRDRAFSEPPGSYSGLAEEHLFQIAALSRGKLPDREAVRKILARARLGKVPRLDFTNRLAIDFSCDPRSDQMSAELQAIALLRKQPDFQAAEARAFEDEVKERRDHLAAMKTIEAAGAKAAKTEEARKAATIAKVREAERDLEVASRELTAVLATVGAERLERDSAWRRHEGALVAGDWPKLAEFESEARDEWERVRKSIVSQTVTERNQRTGKAAFRTLTNFTSVNRRLVAIMASIREIPELRLIADPRDLPERIAKIKASWPKVEDWGAPAEDKPAA